MMSKAEPCIAECNDSESASWERYLFQPTECETTDRRIEAVNIAEGRQTEPAFYNV